MIVISRHMLLLALQVEVEEELTLDFCVVQEQVTNSCSLDLNFTLLTHVHYEDMFVIGHWKYSDIKVHGFIRINIISCSFSFKLCLFDNVCKYLIYSKLSTNSRFNLPCITTILYIHSSIFKIQSKSSLHPTLPKN